MEEFLNEQIFSTSPENKNKDGTEKFKSQGQNPKKFTQQKIGQRIYNPN